MRTYVVHSGISDQHVALDMLEDEGVANSIISSAHEVLKNIEEHGLDPQKASLK
jgi:pimeloyl-CoA synthetase